MRVLTTTDGQVEAFEGFTLAADHDAKNTLEYRLYVNGTLTMTFSRSIMWAGLVYFGVPQGLPVGEHRLELAAANDGGESRSAPFTVTAVPSGTMPASPRAPGDLRIHKGG
jgi:hypothetical protein